MLPRWLTKVRGALLMALTWAVIWAPFGLLAGMIVDSDGAMDEPWVAVGAFPGFFCGLLFSVLLGLTERRRRFSDLSLARVAMWGALGGFVVIALPFTSLIGTPNTDHAFWRARYMIVAGITVLSAMSAAGSLLLARLAKSKAAGVTIGK